MGCVLGKRDDNSCKRIIDKIGTNGKTFLTDDWEGYSRVIPKVQHVVGKKYTVGIEQV